MSLSNYNLGFVAFNNPQEVESMIVSIQNCQPEGLKYCLLVDHSTDDSAKNSIDSATKLAGWTYAAKENRGFGAGVNELVSISQGCEVLIVLNLDVYFCSMPPFLEMSNAITIDSFSLVGTSLLNEKKHAVAGRLPPFSNKLLTHDFQESAQGQDSDQSFGAIEAWSGAVHGACFAIKTDDFESVGGLDERLFLYAEEFDLQIKLMRFSKRIGFVPSHSIIHHSEGKVSRNNAFLNTYNLRYLASRERKPLLCLLFTLQLVRMLLRIKPKMHKLWISIFCSDLDRRVMLQYLIELSQRKT
jgi:GT2 family glycosyltransferase